MGKSSRQRGPKVGESERELGREPKGTVCLMGHGEKCNECQREEDGRKEEGGRQKPGANTQRRHIQRDSEK